MKAYPHSDDLHLSIDEAIQSLPGMLGLSVLIFTIAVIITNTYIEVPGLKIVVVFTVIILGHLTIASNILKPGFSLAGALSAHKSRGHVVSFSHAFRIIMFGMFWVLTLFITVPLTIRSMGEDLPICADLYQSHAKDNS